MRKEILFEVLMFPLSFVLFIEEPSWWPLSLTMAFSSGLGLGTSLMTMRKTNPGKL